MTGTHTDGSFASSLEEHTPLRDPYHTKGATLVSLPLSICPSLPTLLLPPPTDDSMCFIVDHLRTFFLPKAHGGTYDTAQCRKGGVRDEKRPVKGDETLDLPSKCSLMQLALVKDDCLLTPPPHIVINSSLGHQFVSF